MSVPLAELHCHIEGTLPVTLARELAAREGVDISGLVDGERYLWHGFTGFLAAYDRATCLLNRPEDYRRLTELYLTGIAGDGAIYAELFLAPDDAQRAGMSYAACLEGVAEGVRRARAATGIEARLVAHILRQNGPGRALAAVKTVLAHPHPLVTGIGLAGDERTYLAAEFAPAFRMAAEAGLGCTAHAGEVCGPQSVRHVLDALPVTRIGHGVAAAGEPELMARLAGEGIVLEVCPGSNVALGLYPDRAAHPLARLMAAGVRVTLNSDDPPFFGTSLAREYTATAAVLGLGEEAMTGFTRTAIEAAFLDEATRARLLRQMAPVEADSFQA
ncbi:adenosine deaminase [Afifella pfennigii]|uniref:adenosine deaminase n=1 Tax=Afifella pfennigii TaxID=209897 RepID=UPI00047EAC80|nr:adenosine deaminase [Afifella pfennigii]